MGVVVRYLYQHARTGELVYRRTIPTELRSFAGRSQVRKFLGSASKSDPGVTERLAEAQRDYEDIVRHAALAAEAQRRTAEGRFTELTPAVAEYLIHNAKAVLLEDDEWARWQPKSPERRRQSVTRMRETTREDLQELRHARAAGDLDWIVASWGSALTSEAWARGIFLDQGAGAFRELCRDLNDAIIDGYEAILRRLDGDKVPAPTRIVRPAEAPAKQTRKKTVTDLVAAYRAAKWEGWSPSSRAAIEPVARVLVDALGEHAVAEVTRDDARALMGLVRRLPANLGKQAALKGLSVPQAVDRAEALGLPTIGPNTVNRGYLLHLSAIFNFARQEQWVASNPFEGLSVHDPVAARDKRDAFTPEQLQTLFSTAPWDVPLSHDVDRPGAYWVPLIALFTGARLGEIAGLRLMDVEELEGIPAFRIRPYTGHSIKNDGSRRDLPVHSSLLQLGLLAFVAYRRRVAGPADLLFPDGKANSRGQWGAKLGERFVRHLKALGIAGAKLGMHSFRHGFEDRLRAAGLHGTAEGKALAGRQLAGSEASYGSSFALPDLKAALERVSYPSVSLAHLESPARV